MKNNKDLLFNKRLIVTGSNGSNKISLYENIKHKKNRTIDIEEIILKIRGDMGIKDKIQLLRSETDKLKADTLKKNLPAVTPSGLFNGNRSCA